MSVPFEFSSRNFQLIGSFFFFRIQQFTDFQKTLQDVSVAITPVSNVCEFWSTGKCPWIGVVRRKKIQKRDEEGKKVLRRSSAGGF